MIDDQSAIDYEPIPLMQKENITEWTDEELESVVSFFGLLLEIDMRNINEPFADGCGNRSAAGGTRDVHDDCNHNCDTRRKNGR